MRFITLLKGARSGLCCALAIVVLPAAAQEEAVPRISVSGANTALEANILGHLRVEREACDASRVRLQRLLPQIRDSAADAGEALGYYALSSVAEFGEAEGCWTLNLAVTPGPRVRLETVEIDVLGEAAVQRQFRDILADTPVQPQAPLHHGQYEALKNALTARAADNGFFAAQFQQAEIALDLAANRADVKLVFDPGQQFRFGRVTIMQDGPLAEELIQRLLPLREGDPYSSARLAELRQRLDASQYFRLIRVAPQLGESTDQAVPVEIELGMRPRHMYTTSLGFSTDTGPRARLSYENRYVNSRGHRLFADLAFSTVRSQIDGSYVIPLSDASRQSLSLAGGYGVEDNDSFRSKRFKLETSLRNETLGGWQQTAFVDFQHDDYTVGTEKDTSVLTMPGVSLGKTSADNLIMPTSGWKLFMQLRGASNALLSSNTFMQFYGSARHIASFGRGRLLSRLEFGATWIDEAESLPASLRYFTGGDQSIRGYDYRALGPINELGEVTGGKQLMVGSIEYDFLVRSSWRVAVFSDHGNAFNEPGDLDLRHSAGIGLRWLSPIGPVRVDIAHPIDGTESFRLHITMGPDL